MPLRYSLFEWSRKVFYKVLGGAKVSLGFGW